MTPEFDIAQGDVREILRQVRDGFFHAVVTSPPYWGLRDYGLPPLVWGGDRACVHEWRFENTVRKGSTNGRLDLGSTLVSAGAEKTLAPGLSNDHGETKQYRVDQSAFCSRCDAWRGSLGLEPTPDLYVEHIVEVFREVRRTLRDDGTVWLNLGDSYAANRSYQVPSTKGGPKHSPAQGFAGSASRVPPGLKPKDLVGVPWAVAFALRADGWYLRSDVVWQKVNCLPESVLDRPTRSHEFVFLLAKRERYFYDSFAVLEEATGNKPWSDKSNGGMKAKLSRNDGGCFKTLGKAPEAGKRNKRSVWSTTTTPYKGAHFAVMPETLVEPCVKASTSEHGVCSICGGPWRRIVKRAPRPVAVSHEKERRNKRDGGLTSEQGIERTGMSHFKYSEYLATNPPVSVDFAPTCKCGGFVEPAVVLDPFAGSGTTGVVSLRLGRSFMGIDLNPEYCEMARQRIAASLGKAA